MKLATKFLFVPMVGAVMLLAIGGVATYAMRAEKDALVELRQGAIADLEGVLRIDAGINKAHADLYKTLTWLDTLDAAQLAKTRDAIKQSGVQLDERIQRLESKALDDDKKRYTQFRQRVARYFKSGDDAIDLGSVDANTGMAAMQTADQEYVTLARAATELLTEVVKQSNATYQRALTVQERGELFIWVATGVALLLGFAISLMLTRRMLKPLREAKEFADAMAKGNLAAQLQFQGKDELGDLTASLKLMAERLRTMVESLQAAAQEIRVAASEIATGNNDLSSRTEAAASNLQETTSSVDHLAQTVHANADAARQANQLALSASEVAERGGLVVNDVVATMNSISDSSGRIAEINSVIDGIAFQTNILALNAAVEAARAGEQGRGFAVVAGEVRALAQKSAEAAAQIKDLIANSSQEVETGGRLVRDAGSTMREIVSSVRKVTDIIGEISAATIEQSSQIGQVNNAVGQLDQMTQQNAALVEQSAAAAESLKDQALKLEVVTGSFRLSEVTETADPAKGKRARKRRRQAANPDQAGRTTADATPLGDVGPKAMDSRFESASESTPNSKPRKETRGADKVVERASARLSSAQDARVDRGAAGLGSHRDVGAAGASARNVLGHTRSAGVAGASASAFVAEAALSSPSVKSESLISASQAAQSNSDDDWEAF